MLVGPEREPELGMESAWVLVLVRVREPEPELVPEQVPEPELVPEQEPVRHRRQQ